MKEVNKLDSNLDATYLQTTTPSQLTFTYSKLTIETVEKDVKYDQN